MIICAASNNAGKLKELRRILERMGHEVKSLRELGIDLDPEETGTTFAENARTAVDDGGGIVQQIPGLRDLRCAEEPAQQGLVRGQSGVAHDKDQRGADQNKGQRDHYISQWTAAQKRVLLACLHGDMLSLLIWLIITASYIINYFLYKRKV